MTARPIVGIDLGTTHTVVAFGDATTRPQIFLVPQLVDAAHTEPRPLYPSFLYAPPAAELDSTPNVFGDAPFVTGDFAKRRAAEVPGRVITSAKSWLCHTGVDRTAPILPWGTDDADGVPTLSPLEASARLLAHVRRAWDAAHPDTPLFEADVVLTVPASFDEAARELTVRAAELAGLEVRLLEEPLAAFYDYLSGATQEAMRALAANTGGEAFVLVVDVGGGTTDLSLLRVTARTNEALAAERIAVGRHLLLGGDNMDLALAHAAESKLTGGERLDAARFAQLTAACRSAKERLLANDAPNAVPIVVASKGSALVGRTLRTELSQAEATALVLEGFFPFVADAERPARNTAGLVSLGLPYERDVAITRHVADFLLRHLRHLPEGRSVDAVLLNGGVFNAARIRERMAQVLSNRGARSLTVLPHGDPDLAVARGAVHYGLALRGEALKITAGAPRAYYVGLRSEGHAPRAMCVVPRGASEGARLRAHAAGLTLVVGRPVRFDLYTSDDAPQEEAGDLVDLRSGSYERVPPLLVTFPSEENAGPRSKRKAAREETVAITLEAVLTAVGTLELSCLELAEGVDEEPRRFRLAFELRFADDGGGSDTQVSLPAPASFVPKSSLSPRSLPPRGHASEKSDARLDEAEDAIDRAFGKPRGDAAGGGGRGREAKDLVRELERILGERSAWTMERARAVFDALAMGARAGARRRSPDHERVFWMLAGYCLRPGFGAPGDDQRVTELASLFPARLAFPDEPRAFQQFFIAWRRVAGGLAEPTQTAIRDFLDPFLAPPEAGLKKPKKPKLEGDLDMLELAAALERVPAARRAELGAWIVERTWTERDPRLWAALGRVGARVPAYASLHHVISIPAAERFLDHLLREKWESVATAARAALDLGRFTGDRARDLAPRVRLEAAKRLEALPDKAEWGRALREVVLPTDDDRRAMLGEDLPVGLVLTS